MDQQDRGAATRIIFVSLPKLFPAKWVGLVLDTAQSLGVDARVYHGIPKSPPPQTNIAEYEARGEMFSSELVFAALAMNESGEVDGEWVVKHLPELVRREIPIDLGLVGIEAADLSIDSNTPLHAWQSAARIERFATADEWLTYLMEKLLKT